MKYQADFSGKITKTEAVAEVEKILVSAGVPAACYAKHHGGIDVLVGARKVTIPLKAGMTYFEMKSSEQIAHACARDFARARINRNQIDLEDAISSKMQAEE